MISEYHINLVLGKMDKILENQRMILQQLVANNNKIGGKLPPSVYEPEPETSELPEPEATNNETADACTEVNAIVGHKSPCINQPEENAVPAFRVAKVGASSSSGLSKEPSKTQLFKSYRDKGGKLSWNKWKAAGMPQE